MSEVSDHLFRNHPDSFRPSDGKEAQGERAETQVSPDHTVFSVMIKGYVAGTVQEYKNKWQFAAVFVFL